MSSHSGIKLVFGGAMVGGAGRPFHSDETINALFALLKKHSVTTIDSAQLYENSEATLGKYHAGDHFIIDTKHPGGFIPGTAKDFVTRAKESIKLLDVKKVDIFYIHAPDANYPLEDLLASVDEVHKLGLFSRFGLSNYQATDVQKVHDICKAHNYILPSVYQGNYSPVARKQEEVLFPTLRKLGIAFYAYSPLAGGFLTKTKEQIILGAGRFSESHPVGKMYKGLYQRPAYLEALAHWERIANEEGCSRADLAYRWVTYNSPLKKENGDAIIIGASRLEQMEQTLEGIEKGPLSDKAVKGINEVWETIKHEAPLDNFHG